MPTLWDNIEKTGTGVGGWMYNEVPLTYNQVIDPDSGLEVFYNGVGVTTGWSNQTELSSSWVNESEVSASIWDNEEFEGLLLLTEDLENITCESGEPIALESYLAWDNLTKVSTIFTNEAKI